MKSYIYVLGFIVCTACGNFTRLNGQEADSVNVIKNSSIDKIVDNNKEIKTTIDEVNDEDKDNDKDKDSDNDSFNSNDSSSMLPVPVKSDDKSENLTEKQKEKRKQFEGKALKEMDKFLDECEKDKGKKLALARILSLPVEYKDKIEKKSEEIKKQIFDLTCKLFKKGIGDKFNLEKDRDKQTLSFIYELLQVNGVLSEKDTKSIRKTKEEYEDLVLEAVNEALKNLTNEQKIELFIRMVVCL